MDPRYAGHMAKPIIPLETRRKAIELVLGGMQQKQAAADDKTLRASLKAIAKACEAAGFEPAMQATRHFISHGWDFAVDGLGMLARRFADGDIDYGADMPDLDAYDRFNHPGGDES